MKVLGVLGVITSVIAASVALHLHFIYAKAVVLLNKEIDANISEKGMEFLQSEDYRKMYELVDYKTTYGMIVMLMGAAAVMISIYPAVKKFRIAWVGVAFGLISFLIGAVHGAHLFD
jgi:DMSO reductase anchor subunit